MIDERYMQDNGNSIAKLPLCREKVDFTRIHKTQMPFSHTYSMHTSGPELELDATLQLQLGDPSSTPVRGARPIGGDEKRRL
jgi:hypothetical protein